MHIKTNKSKTTRKKNKLECAYRALMTPRVGIVRKANS